jgi:hypothetical protein
MWRALAIAGLGLLAGAATLAFGPELEGRHYPFKLQTGTQVPETPSTPSTIRVSNNDTYATAVAWAVTLAILGAINLLQTLRPPSPELFAPGAALAWPTWKEVFTSWWLKIGAGLAAICLVSLAVGVAVVTAVEEFGPRYYRFVNRSSLTAPRSQAYSSIHFEFKGEGDYMGRQTTRDLRRVTSLEVRLLPNARPGLAPSEADSRRNQLHIDMNSLGYSYLDNRGNRVEKSAGLDEQAFKDWMQAAGADTSKPGIEDEVRSFLQAIFRVRRGDARNLTDAEAALFSGRSRSDDPSAYASLKPWVPALTYGALLAAWLAACVFWIGWMHHREVVRRSQMAGTATSY